MLHREWSIAVLVAMLLCLSQGALAAVVKSVQSGSAQSTDDGVVSVSITSVDLSRSFLVFQTRHDAGRSSNSTLRGEMISATEIQFEHNTSKSGIIDIQWYVVEFDSGVSVQRGTFTQTSETTNISLSTLGSIDQAFVLVSKTLPANSNSMDTSDPLLPELTSTTNLQIRTRDDPSGTHRVHWQVVEFTGGDLTSIFGSTTLTSSGDTTRDDNFSPAVDTSKAMLLASWYSRDTGKDIDERFITAEFRDGDTVRFERASTGGDDLTEIGYQVIEFADGTSVQHGLADFRNGEKTRTVPITTVDLSRSIALATVQVTGGQNYGRTENDKEIFGEAAFTFELTATNELTITRNSDDDDSAVAWQVIQFAGDDSGDGGGSGEGTCELIDTRYPLYSGMGLTIGTGGLVNGAGISSGSSGASSALQTNGNVVTQALTIPALDPTSFPSNPSSSDTGSDINASGEVFYDDVVTGFFGSLSVTGGGIYHIDRLNVGFIAEVRLNAGIYYINHLEMTSLFSALRVDSGPVVIHVGSMLNLSGRFSSLNSGGMAEDLQIYLHDGATMSVGSSMSIDGVVTGPKSGSATIQDDFTLNGLMQIGGAIAIGDNLQVNVSSDEQAAVGAIGGPCVAEPTDVQFDIGHDGFGINCLAEVVSVTAENSAGATLTTYTQSVTLDTQSGKGSWSLSSGSGLFTDLVSNDGLATYVFAEADNGVATFSLSYTEGVSALDVDVYQTSDITLRDDDTEGALAFSPDGFTVTNSVLSNPPASPINNPITAKTAGTNFDLYLTAFGQTPDDPVCGVIESYTGAKNLAFWIDYVDPVSGTLVPTIDGLAIASAQSTAATQAVTFIDGQAVVAAKYKDVGEVSIGMKDGTIAGATNPFVSKPADLVITTVETTSGTLNPAASTANGTAFVAAGESFTVEVEVRDAEGALTPNYGNEVSPESIEITSLLVVPAVGFNGHLNNGELGNGSSFAATTTAGKFRNTTTQYREVGVVRFTASVADDDYLGIGEVTGTASGPVGRFFPGRIVLNAGSVAGACSNSTYMSQQALGISYTLQAESLLGDTLRNYDATLLGTGNVAAVSLAAENSNAGINLGGRVTTPSGVWTNGEYLVLTTVASFSRLGTADGPYDQLQMSVGVSDLLDSLSIDSPNQNPATGGDCAASMNCSTVAVGGPTEIRYGRLEVLNTFGSETEHLDVPLAAKYFDGTNFAVSSTDSCTTYIHSGASLSHYQGGLPAVSVIAPLTIRTLVSGQTTTGNALYLSAPGAGNVGSVDVTYDAPAWLEYNWNGAGLEDPTGTAVFGTFRGHDKIIYWREVY